MSATGIYGMVIDALTGNLDKNLYYNVGSIISGRKQMENTQSSLDTQIGYEEYLKQGNQRAYDDWMHYVGSKGRTIRYPELSYPGQIRRADTSIARARFDYDTASANYWGNLPYRGAGLYGIVGRVARTL